MAAAYADAPPCTTARVACAADDRNLSLSPPLARLRRAALSLDGRSLFRDVRADPDDSDVRLSSRIELYS